MGGGERERERDREGGKRERSRLDSLHFLITRRTAVRPAPCWTGSGLSLRLQSGDRASGWKLTGPPLLATPGPAVCRLGDF